MAFALRWTAVTKTLNQAQLQTIDKSAAKGVAGCVVDSHTAGPWGGIGGRGFLTEDEWEALHFHHSDGFGVTAALLALLAL